MSKLNKTFLREHNTVTRALQTEFLKDDSLLTDLKNIAAVMQRLEKEKKSIEKYVASNTTSKDEYQEMINSLGELKELDSQINILKQKSYDIQIQLVEKLKIEEDLDFSNNESPFSENLSPSEIHVTRLKKNRFFKAMSKIKNSYKKLKSVVTRKLTSKNIYVEVKKNARNLEPKERIETTNIETIEFVQQGLDKVPIAK
jgi:hypothetical protein